MVLPATQSPWLRNAYSFTVVFRALYTELPIKTFYTLCKSRDISVNKVIAYGLDDRGLDLARSDNFLFTVTSGPVMDTTQSLTSDGYRGSLHRD
jgi:hypothetical protein